MEKTLFEAYFLKHNDKHIIIHKTFMAFSTSSHKHILENKKP